LFKAVVVASPFTFDTTPWDTPEQQAEYAASYGGAFLPRYRAEIAAQFMSREKYDEWAPWSILRARNDPLPCELLITVGDQDNLGLFKHNAHLHELMAERGIRHEWRVQQGVGHGTVEDPYLMDWLNEKAK
jgi:enterochelin esterase-like enzyme